MINLHQMRYILLAIFYINSRCNEISFRPLQKLWRHMIHRFIWEGMQRMQQQHCSTLQQSCEYLLMDVRPMPFMTMLAWGRTHSGVCVAILWSFAHGPECLRTTTNEDVESLMAENEERGWPGMLASIYYMHWTWENYPVACQCQCRAHCHEPTIIL